MIEEGFVKLVQGAPAVAALATVGGFFAELPKDQPLPTWTYTVISNVSNYGLSASPPTVGLNMNRMQVDCFAAEAADAIKLARAIDDVLSGYRGILTDADATRVHGCFQSDVMDFFDDQSRTYRRMLEYELWFSQ